MYCDYPFYRWKDNIIRVNIDDFRLIKDVRLFVYLIFGGSIRLYLFYHKNRNYKVYTLVIHDHIHVTMHILCINHFF